MKVTFLGTGTSTGVPVVGCDCPVCSSADPRDKRLRSSVLVDWNGLAILIDAGPDFRFQALRAGIQRVDHLLITHSHADHVNGLDDLRPISYGRPIPVWSAPDTKEALKQRFAYMFLPPSGPSSRPELLFRIMPNTLDLGNGRIIQAVPIHHGPQRILGYRMGNFAYLTDCSGIPPESMEKLSGVSTVVIGALRPKPHPTHFSFEQAIDALAPLHPGSIWLTHLSHEVTYDQTKMLLQGRARAAYDGLVLSL